MTMEVRGWLVLSEWYLRMAVWMLGDFDWASVLELRVGGCIALLTCDTLDVCRLLDMLRRKRT